MKERTLTTSIPAREVCKMIQTDTAACAETKAAILGADEQRSLLELIADQEVDFAITKANIYDAGLEDFLSGGDRKYSNDGIDRITKFYGKCNPGKRIHNTAALEAMQESKRHWSRIKRETIAANRQEDLAQAIEDAIVRQKDSHAELDMASEEMHAPDETPEDKEESTYCKVDAGCAVKTWEVKTNHVRARVSTEIKIYNNGDSREKRASNARLVEWSKALKRQEKPKTCKEKWSKVISNPKAKWDWTSKEVVVRNGEEIKVPSTKIGEPRTVSTTKLIQVIKDGERIEVEKKITVTLKGEIKKTLIKFQEGKKEKTLIIKRRWGSCPAKEFAMIKLMIELELFRRSMDEKKIKFISPKINLLLKKNIYVSMDIHTRETVFNGEVERPPIKLNFDYLPHPDATDFGCDEENYNSVYERPRYISPSEEELVEYLDETYTGWCHGIELGRSYQEEMKKRHAK